MKSNLKMMTGPLEAAIKDHEDIIAQIEAEKAKAIEEGYADTVPDKDKIIVEHQNAIAKLKSEFLANENFFKKDDLAHIEDPGKDAFDATVVSVTLLENPIDVAYTFDNGEAYSQTQFDGDIVSERV